MRDSCEDSSCHVDLRSRSLATNITEELQIDRFLETLIAYNVNFQEISMDAYSLKKFKTGEFHLFKGKMKVPVSDGKCWTATVSECGKMNKEEGIEFKFQCVSEQNARDKIAKIGRDVCGTCVATLYATC